MYRKLREAYVHLRRTEKYQDGRAERLSAEADLLDKQDSERAANAKIGQARFERGAREQARRDADVIEEVLDDWLDRLACEENYD